MEQGRGISAAAVIGLAAGSLAGAAVSSAAAEPTARPAASTQDVSPLAVNNLGQTVARAKNWQCFLARSGYEPWEHNGLLGTDSWKAAQRMFNARGFNGGTRLDVDGVVGPKTRDAFSEFNDVPAGDRRWV